MSNNKRILIFFITVLLFIALFFHIARVTDDNVTRYLLIMTGTTFDPTDEQSVLSHDYSVAFQNTTLGYIPLFADVRGNITVDNVDLGSFHFTGRLLDSGQIPVGYQGSTRTDRLNEEIRLNSISGWVCFITPIPLALQKILGIAVKQYDIFTGSYNS